MDLAEEDYGIIFTRILRALKVNLIGINAKKPKREKRRKNAEKKVQEGKREQQEEIIHKLKSFRGIVFELSGILFIVLFTILFAVKYWYQMAIWSYVLVIFIAIAVLVVYIERKIKKDGLINGPMRETNDESDKK